MEEKMVKVKLPKQPENGEQELFVGVNGKAWRIRGGVEVTVPASVAEVLANADQAEEALDRFLGKNRKRE